MGGCSKLESIDSSPFSNVTSIGNWFLNCCSNLTSIVINNNMNECFENVINDFINNGINVNYKDDVQFEQQFQNDLQKIKTDKEFCKKLLKYLGLQKKGSHKILINQLRYNYK